MSLWDGDIPVLSRRGALGLLGAAATVSVVSACARVEPAVSAPGHMIRIPTTRSKEVPDTARGVQKFSFPLTAVALTWTGPQTGVRIRFYDQAGVGGPWSAVQAGCPCGRDPVGTPAEQVSRALVAAEGAFGYEVGTSDGTDIRSALAIDSVRGPERRVTLPTPTPTPSGNPLGVERVISRAQWGADESRRFIKDGLENSPTRFFPVQALTVHHTVTANDDPNPAATVRAIYEQHAIGNDWGDIGYHFLIDAAGRVYEGRFSGSDGIPAHDAKGNLVTAFHTAGFNSGNVGISLLGNFEEQPPTAATRKSLAALLAGLARKHDLDPLADITYKNPVDGTTKVTKTVTGHRDWTLTECPGSMTYSQVQALRQAAAELL